MDDLRKSTSLELVWERKNDTLLPIRTGNYEYSFVSTSDPRLAEMPQFVQKFEIRCKVSAVCEETPESTFGNLLFLGDAMHVLTGLSAIPEFRREFVGKVKLAYIDPPFNTQKAFKHYDDALGRPMWLTMMRDRLEQIRGLLSEDGSVWIHLNDAEMAYCRVMADEIFGRSNFVATVIWSRSDVPRSVAKFMSNDQDYILVYAKDATQLRFNRLPRDAKTDSAYKNSDDDKRGPWRLSTFTATKPYSKGRYEITGPTGKVFTPPNGTYWRRPEASFQELNEDGRIYWGAKGDAAPMVKTYLSEVGDLIPRTIWHYQDVGSSRTAKYESKELFGDENSFATPKPERLLQRIISIATDEGDIVLDCFAGSGTTAAVAHKLNRRWVTSELKKEIVDLYTLPRLVHVVGDKGGHFAYFKVDDLNS